MDINEDLVHDDFEAVNSVAYSVRLNRLQLYREKVINNWKRKECRRLKKEIEDLQNRRHNLQEKTKRVGENNRNLEKNYRSALSMDVHLNYAISAMKTQVLEKKRYLTKLKRRISKSIEQHNECWLRAKNEWQNMPRVRKYEELKREIADVKMKQQQKMRENSEKEETMRKRKEEFKKSVVLLATIFQMQRDAEKLLESNNKLEEDIKKKQETISNLERNMKETGETQSFTTTITPVTTALPAINRYDETDLVEFDDEQNNLSMTEIHQESFTQETDFDDFNCSVLSLETSVDHSFFHLAASNPSMSVPVATSTPYSADAVQQESDNDNSGISNSPSSFSQQTNNIYNDAAAVQQIDDWEQQQHDNAVVFAQQHFDMKQIGEHHGHVTSELNKCPEQTIQQEDTYTQQKQTSKLMLLQQRGFSDASQVFTPQQQNEENFKQDNFMVQQQQRYQKVLNQPLVNSGMEQHPVDQCVRICQQPRVVEFDEEAAPKETLERSCRLPVLSQFTPSDVVSSQRQSLSSQQQMNLELMEDEDVDYKTRYAKSPEEDGSTASAAESSPPPRPPMPTFNFLGNAPGSATNGPMSFFNFNTDSKTSSSSIFNLF